MSVSIDPSELEFHSWPLPVPGAMHFGIGTGLLIIHKPTGIAVVAESERNQLSNRTEGLKKLSSLIGCDIILRSYDFCLREDGVLEGLTAGDHGFEDTGICVSVSHMNKWSKK